MNTRSNMNPWSLPAFMLCAAMTGGWTNKLAPPSAGMDEETLTADSRYMRRLFAQRAPNSSEDFIRIDLADKSQYGFVMRRLHASGKTPENSPYLYQRLARAHSRAMNRKEGSVSITNTGSWVCDHFVVIGNGGAVVNGRRDYLNVPIGSCTGGANYIYADIVNYDSNLSGTTSSVVSSDSGEEYGGGTNFDDVAATAAIATTGARKLVTDSMLIAMNDTTGEEVLTYSTLEASVTAAAQNYSWQHPSYAAGVATGDILSCQLRGGSDCQYAVVKDQNNQLLPFTDPATGIAQRLTSSPWTGDRNAYFPFPAGTSFDNTRVYVPLKGEYNAGSSSTAVCTIKSVSPISKLRLVKTVSGGTCMSSTSLQDSLKPFINQSKAPISKLLDLSKETSIPGEAGSNCAMAAIVNEPVDVVLTIGITADCGQGSYESRNVTVRTISDYKWNLRVLNSCMAEGTAIVHADGKKVPVQEVKVGDKVVANSKGDVLTVTDVLSGGENKPLVLLRDNLGQEVKLTEQHPVLLASGDVVQAVKVKAQDKVMTTRGVSTIVSIKRLPYDGRVYNLELGTPEELARVGMMGRTMFANGFLVGDNSMQVELSTPKLKTAAALSDLPKAWHEDFQKRPGAAALR